MKNKEEIIRDFSSDGGTEPGAQDMALPFLEVLIDIRDSLVSVSNKLGKIETGLNTPAPPIFKEK